ncbi:hypothetical protein B0T26DRAFT_802690 [Lasiosphaeria miniovina]|uniref:Uncharacterized protein n=1 Tax=Lasiosphaeria miniovina TaxID=1954250 RepID=A0AA40AKN5_9PEZI|nr:uncharacterized protein B0T26DRAFT_802690 [Lasiosphaeria miniovina]KAK0717611.1 hypothetical protein B0T26DRAFT_802690 [Lasiosphaeria miniovina]
MSTFSSCREYCTALPTTTSCTSTCDNVVGCDTTGTEIAVTITPASATIAGLTENWQGDGDANLDSVALSVISFLGAIGDFGSASPSPTATNILNIPAPQPSNAAEYDTYMYVAANVCSGASPAKYGHWVITSGVAGLVCGEFFNRIEAAIEFEEPLEENLVDYASCAGVGVSWANLFAWNFKASNDND